MHGERPHGADVHTTAHGGAHTRAEGYFLMETPECGQESMLEQVLLTGTVAHGGPTLEQVYPEDSSFWRGHTLEQRKSVRRKEWLRGAVMDCL